MDETSNAVQPDLLFVAKSNLSIFDLNGPIRAVPDLIIEILSPANAKHDKVRKKDLYEKFGVKEYWIVDPSTKNTIGYSLVENKFVSLGEFGGEVKSVLLKQSFKF